MLGTVTSLATLPLRLAVRGATLILRTAGQVVTGAGADAPAAPYASAPASTPVHPREPVRFDEEEREPPRPAPRPPSPPAAAPANDPPPPALAPPTGEDHVSEEPVFVAAVADPGAEEGAGPEISVAEPWPDYGSMKASEVVARLEGAAPAEVAVARLYEQINRGRKSVLDAADRRLKALDA